MSLSCSTFELGRGDYLIVTAGSQRNVYFAGSGIPADSAPGKLQVEFRSNSVDHGRLSCSIRVTPGSGSGSGSESGSIPEPTEEATAEETTTTTTTTAAPLAVTTEVSDAVSPAAANWLNGPNCGQTKYDTRIVGGGPAPANAYPWLVSGRTVGTTVTISSGSP